MVLLLFTRPNGWGFGLGMLALSLAGIVAHLVFAAEEGNFSGYIRLGLLAAFPLLPALLHRLSTAGVFSEAGLSAVPSTRVQAKAPAETIPSRTQERRRYSSSARTVRAWLEMNYASDPEKVISGMAKGIAHTMLSDMCFIVNGPNYGHIVLHSGYDLIREEEIKGTMLEQGQLPMLSNALQRGKALRVTTDDSQPPDLKTLSAALGLKETGSMMYLPLMIAEKPQGGILFLSPYSNRQWSPEDQNYISSEIELIASIVQRAQQAESRQTPEQIGANLRTEIDNLRQENQRLLGEVNQVRQNGQPAALASQLPSPAMDLSALVALQQEAQDQITSLQAENERLQAALKEQGINVLSPEEFERLEDELRSTLQEIAFLQNQLAESNARNMMLERDLQQGGVNEDHAVVISIVQEIRQPMSSIIGYTELLLAETGGILGALQRKFLERIRASTERMHSMLDDLIQVAAMGEGPLEILPQAVELGTVIDGAIAETSAQLREKNIALRVDLPEELPLVNADRDAIQQIVLQLLQNAGAATPPEGTITLRAHVQKDDKDDYLLLQITDTGTGIRPEDLPRVFSRRYRADMPLIEGLGDTGVGLSIAKTLVEAHGGRIWVDSTFSTSTTFSVLLPIQPILLNSTAE
jgi:signal transduction histidine kinase